MVRMTDDQVEEWRAQVQAEWGLFTAAEAARRAGSRGHSPTAAVRQWVKTRKVFPLRTASGLEVYAGFCFGPDGRPLPIVGEVVKAMADRLSGWELAGWWLTPNSTLGGRRPVDALDQPDELRAAVGR